MSFLYSTIKQENNSQTHLQSSARGKRNVWDYHMWITWLSPMILGCGACELHFCTVRLYFEHHFIYKKLTGSHIEAWVSFIVMLKHFLGLCIIITLCGWTCFSTDGFCYLDGSLYNNFHEHQLCSIKSMWFSFSNLQVWGLSIFIENLGVIPTNSNSATMRLNSRQLSHPGLKEQRHEEGQSNPGTLN